MKECQVIRQVHLLIGCSGGGGSSGSNGDDGGGGIGSKSGGSSGIRPITLLMLLFWLFQFKFLLATAAAINKNNFLVLHHVAKFVLGVLMMFTAKDVRKVASPFLLLVLLELFYIHEISKKFPNL